MDFSTESWDWLGGWLKERGLPGMAVAVADADGEVEFTIGNAPPKTFKKGDTYLIPVKTPHIAKAGAAGVKLVGTFVVEKDQPLASPAP